VWFNPESRPLALHVCRTHCEVLQECLASARADPPYEGVQAGIAFNQKRQPLPDFWHHPARSCARCVRLPPKAAPTNTGACGSYGGYRRHLRLGEEACDPCRVASARRERDRRNQAMGARKKQQKEQLE
jgi:hypothetical protein